MAKNHTLFFHFFIPIVLCFWLWAEPVLAQNQKVFLYGKIFTQSNIYEGPIRWGKEEVYWSDYFNASKRANPEYKNTKTIYIEGDSWFNLNWDLQSIWEDQASVHQFNCQFGDIKQMKVLGRAKAKLQFKNGWEIEVQGEGYNDMGENIVIIDKDLGTMQIDWGKISKVEFSNSPQKVQKFGESLYGTVETNRREKFTGWIEWDHDERIGTDKLDGYSKDGNVSLFFSEIAKIEKQGNGSLVETKSGKSVLLGGTNDVNTENRGINVLVEGLGMVDIPWESFKRVTFQKKEDGGQGFEDFPVPKALSGKVFLLEEKEFSGKLVYDLDETLDLETLEGKDNGNNFTIPFRNIKSIKPKNNQFAQVELKSGQQFLLNGSNDVSGGNNGILIFQKGKKEPVQVPWSQIDQILFD
jgi:sporulation protein YlmC with PRC-barrel domain